MPLCGSSMCGCALVSTPATAGEINGALPTIDVAGNGTPASPWNLTLNDEWAGAVVGELATRGVKGYAQVTANQSFTTVVDATGLSVTFTAVAGRRYRTTFGGFLTSTVANDAPGANITDASNNLLAASQVVINVNGFAESVFLQRIETGLSATSHTRKIRLVRNAGSGTSSLNAGATFPAFIMVEDIGPA